MTRFIRRAAEPQGSNARLSLTREETKGTGRHGPSSTLATGGRSRTIDRILTARRVAETGVTTSVLGFGAGAIGNRRRALTEVEAIQLIERAYEAGVRYFDTAPLYGHGLAERRLGAAIHGLPRQELTLSSKVGRLLKPAVPGTFDTGIWVDVPPFAVEYDYSYDGAMRSIEATLNRMLVDHLDIAFIHDPDHYTHGALQPLRFSEAMKGARLALLKLKDEGVVKAVGMGVNDTDVVVAGADVGGFDVFLLAGKYTLLHHESLDDLMPRAVRDGFSLVIGGVFNSGILATGGSVDSYYQNERPSLETIRRVNQIAAIASRYEVPLATLAFHFALAHPAVSSVLVGMSAETQLRRNVAMTESKIPRDLWEELVAANLVRQDAPRPLLEG